MRIHMIRSILGIVLDDENRKRRPDLAAGDRFHNLADRDIVRRDLRLWRERSRGGALRVVLAERHEHEVGYRPGAVHFLELFDEPIRTLVVADALRGV